MAEGNAGKAEGAVPIAAVEKKAEGEMPGMHNHIHHHHHVHHHGESKMEGEKKEEGKTSKESEGNHLTKEKETMNDADAGEKKKSMTATMYDKKKTKTAPNAANAGA